MYQLLDLAAWDGDYELNPDFLANVISYVSQPFDRQGDLYPLGLVRDPHEALPEFDDHKLFFWDFKEVPCCDLFKTVLNDSHLSEVGFSAAMDILGSYQKKARI